MHSSGGESKVLQSSKKFNLQSQMDTYSSICKFSMFKTFEEKLAQCTQGHLLCFCLSKSKRICWTVQKLYLNKDFMECTAILSISFDLFIYLFSCITFTPSTNSIGINELHLIVIVYIALFIYFGLHQNIWCVHSINTHDTNWILSRWIEIFSFQKFVLLSLSPLAL